MADLRDEHGNQIQLTDELGNPVKLTDEQGNPMHLTGIATTHPPAAVAVQEVDIINDSSTAAGVINGGGMFAAKPNIEDLARTEGGIGIGSSTGPDVGLGQVHEDKHGTESLGKLMADVEIREERHQPLPLGEVVHRSTTSSSSSSSEDDGQGGRRKKKGLKEKIKEKLTGGNKHKDQEHHHHSETTTTVTPEVHEKKSMMEKIKEKLPGHHNHN